MKDREIMRTDATAEAQANLDQRIKTVYPLISSNSAYKDYSEGNSIFASFKLQKGSPFLAPVLDLALQKSADPEDPAFSEHANLHGHFQEVVGVLRESVQDHKAALKVQPTELRVGTATVVAHRLVVEAPRRIRPTFRPGPHQFHLELEEKLKAVPEAQRSVLQARILRRSAEEYGVPFAILAGMYSGLTAGPIVQLFESNEVRERIKQKRSEAGVKNAKIPANNSTDHTALHRMVGRIRDTLVVDEGRKIRPSYHPPHYFEALQEFDGGYVRDFSPALKEFVQTNEMVTPRAVFKGLDEAAQEFAESRFLDPHRTTYIDRSFWPYATTEMVTAYFESPIEPTTHHFSYIISGKKK